MKTRAAIAWAPNQPLEIEEIDWFQIWPPKRIFNTGLHNLDVAASLLVSV